MTPPAIEPTSLRTRAEARMSQGQTPGEQAPDPQRLLHELQVHQIELEMQNEELIAANRELDGLRKHFEALYQHAPVGYLTLSLEGLVLAANERAIAMLKRDKQTLVGTQLRDCFVPESARRFTEMVASSTHDGDDVFADNLLAQRPHNVPIYIKVQCRKLDMDGGQNRVILLAIMDVSALKFAMDDVVSRLKS